MRHFIQGRLPKQIHTLFSGLDYYFHDIKNDILSMKCVMHERPFPRFHLYIRRFENGTELDLHIDQEHPHKNGNHEEEWAYEGPIIKKELKRILKHITYLREQPVAFTMQSKKSFFKILMSR